MNSQSLELSTLIVDGPDAEKFLQGLLTVNTATLKNTPQMGAACNRKGRVVANFFIEKDTEGRFHLAMPTDMLPILMTHLKKFVIAANVSFEKSEKTKTISLLDEIKKEIPYILPTTSGLFTPQMISLDKLNALDFKKGCYLGQEIVARTQHLGKLKRHMHLLSLSLEEKKHPGDEITTPDGRNGIVVNIAQQATDQLALVVLRDQ